MGKPGRPPKPKLPPVDTTSPQLSKAEVLENWGDGLYRVHPELWIPHAIGEELDPWQERVIRKLFLGEKKKVSVRAGHGCGKCRDINDLARLSNGKLVTFGSLIGKSFEVPSVDVNDWLVTKATAFAEDNGIRSVWKISTEHGKVLTATGNHPLWHESPYGRQWTQLQDLHVNDKIRTVRWREGYHNGSPYPFFCGFQWERIAHIEYMGEQPTVAVHVPGNETYLTDFVEHNTYLSSRLTLQFLMNFTPSICVATGPTGKQTSSQYWSQLCMAVNKSVFADDIETLKTRLFVKGKLSQDEWKAVWVTSKEPRTIEGFHGKNLLWIIEEAKTVADPVWESISGAFSQDNNFLYESSTCGPPRGRFFDSHTRLRHLYDTEHVPSTESRQVSPEKIRLWKEQWGEDSPVYRARVLAEFPEEDDSSIASLSWLTRAIESQEDDLEAA